MPKRPPLARSEIEELVESIRLPLDDPDACLSRDGRLRWEGALTGLEAALGRVPGLAVDDPESFRL